MTRASPIAFLRPQQFLVGTRSFLPFAVILDFMIMSPLGAMVMPAAAPGANPYAVDDAIILESSNI